MKHVIGLSWLILAFAVQANDVHIVAEGVVTQTRGVLVDPLGLEGATLRVVATYDDAISSDNFIEANGGGIYQFLSAVKSIEYGFKERPGGNPAVEQGWYANGSGDLSLTGCACVAISSYDDDVLGPGRISIAGVAGNFGGAGPYTYFGGGPQFQGIATWPRLPTILQWLAWQNSVYGQNDPFNSLLVIQSDGSLSDPDYFRYQFAATPAAAIYAGGMLPPLEGAVLANIDIAPNDASNAVHPHHDGSASAIAGLNDVVSVVVFGAATSAGDPVDLSAEDIDASTVRFGTLGAELQPGSVPVTNVDYDGDGIFDAKFDFLTGDTGISCADTEGALAAQTITGEALAGMDLLAPDCDALCHD